MSDQTVDMNQTVDGASIDRDPVELLAAEFVDRHRSGECPTIEEYVERHPDLADDIRELFPTIAGLERLKVSRELSSDGRASIGAAKIERLGDFRIIREIGRGGMGIVYEAEQESLGRRVAIKVLPKQSLLNPRQLTRFQREAQTAARLHHTHIVPVFGVGEHDGYHFIVMQLIRGVGMDEVVAEVRSTCIGDDAAGNNGFNAFVRGQHGLFGRAVAAAGRGRTNECRQRKRIQPTRRGRLAAISFPASCRDRPTPMRRP